MLSPYVTIEKENYLLYFNISQIQYPQYHIVI